MSETAAEANAAKEASRKALHRSLAFGSLLILAHILDISPSEVDAAGMKFSIKDASVVYGAISLVFLYQLSHSLSRSEVGDALSPLNINSKKMRTNIKILKSRNRKLKPRQLKSDARNLIRISNVLLFPYRVCVITILLVSVPVSISDIYSFGKYGWNNSKFLGETRSSVAKAVPSFVD